MRKFVKRLTAVMLSLAMVAACALQVGAETGKPVKSIVLTYDSGVILKDGKYSQPFEEKYNILYKKEGYSVTKDDSGQTITIKGVEDAELSQDFEFSFMVQKSTGQEIACELVSGTTIGDGIISRSEENDHVRFTLLPIAMLDTDDDGNALKLKITSNEAPYNITLPSGDGINYETEGKPTVDQGSDYTFSVTVYDQMNVPEVIKKDSLGKRTVLSSESDASDATTGGWKYDYKISSSDISGDLEIVIDIKKPVNVSLPASNDQYTVENKAQTTRIKYGSDFTFTVNAKPGFNVTAVKADGMTLEKDSAPNYTVSGVKHDTVVTVEVSAVKPSVTFSRFRNETFTDTAASESEQVSYGGSYSFQVTPADGYDAPTVTITGGGSNENNLRQSGSNYTLYNITQDMQVTITGKSQINKVPLIFNAVDGVTFKKGDSDDEIKSPIDLDYNTANFTFRVCLDDAHKNSTPKVTAGGKTITAKEQGHQTTGVYTYTITYKITTETIINVTGVELNTYSVKLTKSDQYTLSSNQDTVRHGETFIFRVSVDPKYEQSFIEGDRTKKIKVTGPAEQVNYEESTDTYTLVVNGDITISIDGLTVTKCTVTYDGESDQDGYTFGVDKPQTVDYGSSASFTVTAKPGYRITAVSYTMGGVTYPLSPVGDGQYVIPNITGPVTVKAATKEVVYTVLYNESKAPAERRTLTKKYTVSNMDGLSWSNKGQGIFSLPASANQPVPKQYTFAGWYSGGEKQVTLQFGNEDITVSLEAKYEVNYEKLFDITLKGEWSGADNSWNLLLTATWAADEIEELRGQEIVIEDCGFFISENDFTLTQDFVGRAIDIVQGHARQLLKVDKERKIYIFNFEDKPTDLKGKFLKGFSAIPNGKSLHVLAYARVRIGGNTYYYYSNDGSLGSQQMTR